MQHSKKIILCTDGTWNTPRQKDRGKVSPSNVYKTYQAIRPHDDRGTAQLTYYDEGVGTEGFWDKLLGGAFGVGLSRHIKEAYAFLAKHYAPGDELYLFGFSRGSYTARSLGGLIGLCGIPKEPKDAWIDGAYRLYRSKSRTTEQTAAVHGRAHFPVPIHFIGVWDTVGALGIPGRFKPLRARYDFHNTDIGAGVRHAYHALAIDERRSPYKPTLWSRPRHANHVQMEQRWFAGAHANVGGGYADSGLSDLALRWMIEKAAAAGLAFDQTRLARLVAPDYRGELRDECNWFYKTFYRPVWRPIRVGEPSRMETIDPSAIDRHRAKALDYDPPNLLKALPAWLEETSLDRVG